MGEVSGKIFQLIPAIMGEIDAVGKNKKNQVQGFMYRGIDDVMNAINPRYLSYLKYWSKVERNERRIKELLFFIRFVK